MAKASQVSNAFGKRIAVSRQKKRFSQRALANLAGINSGYLAGIEGGYSRPPSVEVINRLAKVLDEDPKELHRLALKHPKTISQFAKQYPEVAGLICDIEAVMDEKQKSETLSRLERRIRFFNEDRMQLARNFVSFIKGELPIDNSPEPGMCPIGFYLKPWSEGMKEWLDPMVVFDDL